MRCVDGDGDGDGDGGGGARLPRRRRAKRAVEPTTSAAKIATRRLASPPRFSFTAVASALISRRLAANSWRTAHAPSTFSRFDDDDDDDDPSTVLASSS
ncbi:hypothetical protein V9T40_008259 [Parthenolecanium corni]|uniref:Uncharacterized protein n=1 Tax=Parthenolecanium corni TaxID=536013 RepID=A0AAN9TZR1_9HEMI